jgi:hypothetical protein
LHSEDRFESKTSRICDWSEYNWRHHNLMCGLFFQLQQILSETHTILDNLPKLVLFGLSQLSAIISCTYLFLQSESSCIYLILSASHCRTKSSHTWSLAESLQLLILIPQTQWKESKPILNVQSASVRGSLQSSIQMRPWKQQQKPEPLRLCWNRSTPATSMRQTVITSVPEAVQ